MNKSIKIIINSLIILVMLTGVSGMLYSLTPLHSMVLENVISAGFAFMAGSVLTGTGLIALVFFNNTSK